MNKALIVSLFFSLSAFAAENGIAASNSSIDVCSVDVCKPVAKTSAVIHTLNTRDQEEIGEAVEILRSIGAENGLSDDQLKAIILQQLKH